MSYFAINLLLALIWMSLQGVSLVSLVSGFLLGFLVLMLSRPFIGSGPYVRAGLASIRLAVVFLRDLVQANVRLAGDVLRREPRFHPALLRVEAGDLGPAQVTLLGALVSLTPGSVTVDVTDDHTLYVHTVYGHDATEARAEVRRLAALIREAAGAAPGEQGTGA